MLDLKILVIVLIGDCIFNLYDQNIFMAGPIRRSSTVTRPLDGQAVILRSGMILERLKIGSGRFVLVVSSNGKSAICCHVASAALIVGKSEKCEIVVKRLASIKLYGMSPGIWEHSSSAHNVVVEEGNHDFHWVGITALW